MTPPQIGAWMGLGSASIFHLRKSFWILLNACILCSAFPESFERNLLVRVEDHETKDPIANVRVSANYFLRENFEGEVPESRSMLTDSDGLAILLVTIFDTENVDQFKRFIVPMVDIEIHDEKYDAHRGQSQDIAKELIEREETNIPIKPDYVFSLESKLSKQNRLAKEEKEKEEIKAEAIKLNNEQPNLWPKNLGNHENLGEKKLWTTLVHLRWELAENSGLEFPSEIDSISTIIKEHLGNNNPSVGEIYFLDENTAMAMGSWYIGPLAAAGYFYAVKKKDGHWSVIERYRLWIS